MMEHAISMLKAQGHTGDLSSIMMVGDRFDTDIRGGVSVGIKTCLVQSGAHNANQQHRFPDDLASWTIPSVAGLVPSAWEGEGGARNGLIGGACGTQRAKPCGLHPTATEAAAAAATEAAAARWQSVGAKVPFGAGHSRKHASITEADWDNVGKHATALAAAGGGGLGPDGVCDAAPIRGAHGSWAAAIAKGGEGEGAN
jgi:hypothetical protein